MKALEMTRLFCRAMGVSVVLFLSHRLLPLGARLYSELEYPSKSQQELSLFLSLSLAGIAALLLVGLFLLCFSKTAAKWMLQGCDGEAVWSSVPKRDFSEMIYSILGGIFILSLMTQFTYIWAHVFEYTLKEHIISFFGIWLQLVIGIYLLLGPARMAEKLNEFRQWGHKKTDFQ